MGELFLRPLYNLGVHLREREALLEVADHDLLVEGFTGEDVDGDAVALVECMDRDVRHVDDDETRPPRVLWDPLDDVGPGEDIHPDQGGEFGQDAPAHLLVNAVMEDAVYD